MYARISIDSPFVMLSECNCNTDYRELNLVNFEPVCLKVAFPFDKCNVEESQRVPKRYSGYINIYYDDHKHVVSFVCCHRCAILNFIGLQDKILCTAEVNFPHLVFVPSQIDMYCPTGNCIEKKVTVVNDSPLPVYFNMEWIKESFKYEWLSPLSEVR